MVVFQEKDLYFLDTMKAMNVMRKDMALCDIVLTFGQQTIHAHRCVLAAASPYFNTLFRGNFNEASMGNIDLSSVTKDTEAVETIINFIYTGEIDITEDNLDALIKLASFFLIEWLSKFCLEFMNKTLNLKNCLIYFFYSQDYGYHELYQKALPFVESRFHDFIIFEQTSLDISPGELHFLSTNKVLQFCHVPDLLEFVLKWLLKEPTEKHFAVALDVIDNVSCNENVARLNQRETELKDLYEKVAARQEVQGTESGKKFLKSSRKVLSKLSCFSCPVAVELYNLFKHSPQLSSKPEGHTEMALMAFAPRLSVVEAIDKKMAEGEFNEIECFTQPYYDLCVYVVSSHSWYHVHQLADEGVSKISVNDLSNMERCATMRDKVIFILHTFEEVYFYDLRHITWHKVPYSNLRDDLDVNETIPLFEATCVLGANQAVYLILKIRVLESGDTVDVHSMYFRCYRLQSDDKWEFVFKTPAYDTEDEGGNTVAMISSGSNEMLILHSNDCNNCVYLADMSELRPEPIPLLMTSETNERLFQSAHLLEGNNQMYVVKDTPQKVFVTYKYKLKSRKLVPVSATPAFFTASTIEANSYPCLDKYSVSDGTSLWRVEVSRQRISRLTELRVTQHESLVQIKHTPPPFPFIATLFAGRLDKDIIRRLEPIVRYLSP